MSSPGELRFPVDKRAAIKRREEPLVRVEDERVRLLDTRVLVAQRSRKDSGSAVRAVDVEPPTALLGYLTNPGKIINDARIRRPRGTDDCGDIADIGVCIERGIHRRP